MTRNSQTRMVFSEVVFVVSGFSVGTYRIGSSSGSSSGRNSNVVMMAMMMRWPPRGRGQGSTVVQENRKLLAGPAASVVLAELRIT